MNFAIFDFDENGKRVISANEYALLNKYESNEMGITEYAEPNENESIGYTIYGAYFCQPGVSEKKALSDIGNAADHWLRVIVGDACHIVGLQRVAFGSKNHLNSIPVAMLILCTDSHWICELNSSKKASTKTLFLKYQGQSILTNILNRPGVFAVDTMDRSLSGFNVKSNKVNEWDSKIDKKRMQQAALRIY